MALLARVVMRLLETLRKNAPPPAHVALLFASYIIAAGLGHGLGIIPGVQVTFWPPAGIFVCALLLNPKRTWAWYVVGAFAAEMVCNAIWFHNPWPLAIVYFGANALEALTASWLLRKFLPGSFRLDTLGEVAAFVVLAGCIAPVVGATLIATTDAVIGKHAFLEIWPLIWLGDGSGLLVSTPLAIAVTRGWQVRRRVPPIRVLEAALLCFGLVGLIALYYRGWLSTPYMTLPVLLWGAMRFQLTGAAACLSVITLTIATFTVAGHGSIPVHPDAARQLAVTLQAFLGLSAVCGLLAAAMSVQRQQALSVLRQSNVELEARVASRTATLQESESRMQLFIRNAPTSIAMLDQNMRYLAASRRWCSEYGIDENSVIGRCHYDVFPDLPIEWRAAHERVLSGHPLRSDGDRWDRADGSLRWIKWELLPWRKPDGDIGGLLVATEDITSRKDAETALAEAASTLSRERERLNLAMRAGNLGAYEWVIGASEVWWSKEMYPVFGVSPETFAPTVEAFTALVVQEDREELWRKTSACLESREPFVHEYRIQRPDGEVRWVMNRSHVLLDSAGRIERITGVAADITERRRVEIELARHSENLQKLVDERTAELRESYDKLRFSERMAALGTLSAGLGHDMGNILVPIRVRLAELEREAKTDDSRESVEAIRRSADYLGNLASGLRMLSIDPETTSASSSGTSLHAWWMTVEGLYKAVLPRGVTMMAKLPDGPLDIAMPGHAITQIVFNLVQNAGDVLRDRPGGIIVLEAERHGDRVHVSVKDNGPGMSEDVQKRCLEPFYTTKSRDRGTGLGLSIVHGTLKRFNSDIVIRSEVGAGACFTLVIPVRSTAQVKLRSVAISVEDVRLGALVRSLLNPRLYQITAHDATRDIDLWVVDGSISEDRVVEFASARPTRQAVRIGATAGGHPQIFSVEDGKPGILRDTFAMLSAQVVVRT